MVSRQCVYDEFLERSTDYVHTEISCRLLRNQSRQGEIDFVSRTAIEEAQMPNLGLAQVKFCSLAIDRTSTRFV